MNDGLNKVFGNFTSRGYLDRGLKILHSIISIEVFAPVHGVHAIANSLSFPDHNRRLPI